MGCLIEITLRSSVDSCEKKQKFFHRHRNFLCGVEPLSEEERGGRDVVKLFVPWGENRTSSYLCDRLRKDRNVFKAKIIA